MTLSRARIATLGYPTQKAAIIALYQQSFPPKAISALVHAPINSVHRALCEYRRAGGAIVACTKGPASAPMPLADTVWDLDEDSRRSAFYSRAREAAQAALAGML